MRPAIFPAVLAATVLGVFGCDKGSRSAPGQGASSQPATRAATSPGRTARGMATATAAASRPLENKSSYTLTRDLTLWRIGELRYGNGRYSQVIMLYNELKDATQLPVGLIVKTPDLKTVLTDEKLYPLMADEADALLAARSSFMGVEAFLWDARRASRSGPLAITQDVKQTLLWAAEKVDSAAAGFGQKKPGVVAIPAKAIGQMKSLSETLRGLSAGKCDENGYEIDMVHQRLVLAMSYAIRWARSGYK